MSRRICVVTSSRADYGHLRSVLHEINNDTELRLQLMVTGTHLSPEYGHTIDEIEQDGFNVDERIEMLLSTDTSTGVAKSFGAGVMGYTDAFNRLKPSLLLIPSPPPSSPPNPPPPPPSSHLSALRVFQTSKHKKSANHVTDESVYFSPLYQ